MQSVNTQNKTTTGFIYSSKSSGSGTGVMTEDEGSIGTMTQAIALMVIMTLSSECSAVFHSSYPVHWESEAVLVRCSVLPPGVKYQWPVSVVGELTPPQAPEPHSLRAETWWWPGPCRSRSQGRGKMNGTVESENQAREYKQQSAKLSDSSIKTRDIHYSGSIT